MRLELNQDELCIKRRQILNVRGGIGHVIACHSGSIWVTQEGDLRDIILGAGESFALERKGPVLVQALEQSAISFERSTPGVRKLDAGAWSRRGGANYAPHTAIAA